mmetsp:Transcript_2435/g.2631  ORF Transcript_2435/g.2631 Transcript_2435/m.2631 type:complete len:417 (-) Transcript_2435:257-1507(-)|eukprot:CAMPEP_0198250404 /NCGR_PEP_ID=MMETSP1447-20131203/1618_1 /TAXON_ID=420782 /ORGANISM="Chaetoceros dichaeta, Strain CCMP1751" /LENGTH=416 /DNA_ID=CAMNT_0043935239 /DNA_START=30 /DNA_END=1280 /DNA_ORIENTATION=+
MVNINSIGLSIFLLLSQNYNHNHHHVDAFAISSSQTPSKKILSNQKSKGANQGFGKQPKKQTPVPIQHTADTSQPTIDLIKFLTSQNAKGLSSSLSEKTKGGCEIGISNQTGRRGVYTTQSYRKDDIICRIPSDCVLALSNPDLGGADTPTLAHCGRNFLDMYRNNPVASKTWKAYLDTLPTVASTTPLFDATPDFFTDDEIEALEFPRIVQEVSTHLNELAEVCASSFEDDGGSDSIPFEDLQFATWLVSSRSVKISMEDNSSSEDSVDKGALPDGVLAPSSTKAIRVLIPFLDMINHSSDDANVELHLIDPEKDEAWFTMRATRPIREGKEMTLRYGSGVETSVGLLRQYGFVPEENQYDKFMLKKGGEDCIESLEGWSTTLEEDETALLEDSGLTANMRKVLQLRCQLKRAYV